MLLVPCLTPFCICSNGVSACAGAIVISLYIIYSWIRISKGQVSFTPYPVPMLITYAQVSPRQGQKMQADAHLTDYRSVPSTQCLHTQALAQSCGPAQGHVPAAMPCGRASVIAFLHPFVTDRQSRVQLDYCTSGQTHFGDPYTLCGCACVSVFRYPGVKGRLSCTTSGTLHPWPNSGTNLGTGLRIYRYRPTPCRGNPRQLYPMAQNGRAVTCCCCTVCC